jgi:hypothetical protein
MAAAAAGAALAVSPFLGAIAGAQTVSTTSTTEACYPPGSTPCSTTTSSSTTTTLAATTTTTASGTQGAVIESTTTTAGVLGSSITTGLPRTGAAYVIPATLLGSGAVALGLVLRRAGARRSS